jgi:peptide/nickel transport system substrate-binding protein
LPATAVGYEPLAQRTYDPAAARNLLEQAGWRRGPDGVRVRHGVRLAFTLLVAGNFTSFVRVALLLQSALEPVGIDVTIKTYSYRTVFGPAGPLYRGFFDLALVGASINSDPDLSDLVMCDRWYPKGQNIDRFCDPRVDALERAGLQTDDALRRAAIYRRASRLMWSDVPFVPLWSGRSPIVRSSDLRYYGVNPEGDIGWNASSWDI